MSRKITAAIVGATLSMFTIAPAFASADGQCVSNGVRALDGATKAAVAQGAIEGVSIKFVIMDHLTNGADATEALLGVTICD